MAKIEIKNFAAYQDVMREIELSVPRIIKPAVYDGAAIVADEVRRHLRRSLSKKAGGDLEKSMGLAEMRTSFGFVHTKLGFEGYDRHHHPNIVKARVLEKGREDQPKRKKKPFIAPAVKAVRAKAEEAMQNTVDQQIQKIMNEKIKEG